MMHNIKYRLFSRKYLCLNHWIVFDTAYKLYNHRYAVHRLQECRCEFCGGTYKNTKLLQVHKRVSHTELYEASKKASQQQQILDYAASLSAVSSQAEHYPVI